MTNRPTEEEIKEHFKNAKIVKCNLDNHDYKLDLSEKIFVISKHTIIIQGQSQVNTNRLTNVYLWTSNKGFAEIVKEKSNTFRIIALNYLPLIFIGLSVYLGSISILLLAIVLLVALNFELSKK